MAASLKTICFRVSRTVHDRQHRVAIAFRSVVQIKYASSSTQKPGGSTTDYCAGLVNKHDYENYLCSLLQPATHRTAVMALHAFNVETAQVQDITTDKARAIMRMQFWIDAVENIYKGNPPQTPVALEVARAVEKHKLSKHWFTKIVNARARQIEEDSHKSMKEAEDHAESIVSTLTYLSLECAEIKNVNADHTASHLGRAKGLVTLLRGTPFHASRRKVYIPTEILIKHSVSQEDICRGNQDQKVKDVIFDVAAAAHQHLETARKLRKDVPKESFPIFLSSVICDNYLKALQLADFNVFDKSLQKKNGWLPWQLMLQKWRKTY